jgi:GNAT superfamily N-acetyltransferase
MLVWMSEAGEGSTMEIRLATVADVGTILTFIRDLARYERLEHNVVATEEDLRRWLFGDQRIAETLLAIEAGEPVGFALFFLNFSTFLGQPGIYLEDLFVRETARGRGVGKALLRALATLATARGYGRVEWAVLDWNEPAIAFYKRLGAIVLEDWRICRLTGVALEQLGAPSRNTS